MDHRVHPLHCFNDFLHVAKITLDQFEVRVVNNVLDRVLPVKKEVQDTNAVTLAQQLGKQGRADVSSPSDHQHIARLFLARLQACFSFGANHLLPKERPSPRGKRDCQIQQPSHYQRAAGNFNQLHPAPEEVAQESKNEIALRDRLSDNQRFVTSLICSSIGVEA